VDLAEVKRLLASVPVLPHVDHDDLEPELPGAPTNLLE
jgi:hypothetical protein